jgi:hypothetical protein
MVRDNGYAGDVSTLGRFAPNLYTENGTELEQF